MSSAIVWDMADGEVERASGGPERNREFRPIFQIFLKLPPPRTDWRKTPQFPQSMKVLVVDDDIVARKVLNAFLKQSNYEIQLAEDGLSAFRAMNKAAATVYDTVRAQGTGSSGSHCMP